MPTYTNAADPKSCPNGLNGNPPGRAEFPLNSTGMAAIKQYAHKVTCASACFDEQVTMTMNGKFSLTGIAYSIIFDTRAQNKCGGGMDAKKASRGCEFPNQPQITLVMPQAKMSKGPVSRCYDKLNSMIEDTLDSVGQAVSSGDFSTLQSKLAALDDLSSRAPIATTPIADGSNAQLMNVLQRAGVPEADRLVKESPQAAEELGNAIRYGDPDAIREAAQKLNLKDDLTERIALAAEGGSRDEVDRDYVTLATFSRDTTFESYQSTGECDELCKAAQIIRQKESGGRYGITTCTNVCVYGAYQVHQDNVWKWTCEIGRCTSPQQFLHDPELQDAVFRHKFGQYAERSGSYTTAAGMWHGGPGFNPNRSDAFGTRTGAYMADFARKFGDPNFSYNVADYTVRGGGSPLGNVNPFLSASPVGFPTQTAVSSAGAYPIQQYPIQQASVAPQSSPQPVSSQIFQQTGQGTVQPGSALVILLKPVASIIVQPREVLRGNTLVVSWSSVGMSGSSPCVVSKESAGVLAEVARGNEGSRTLATSASEAGTLRFTLRCTASSGERVEHETSALVK